MWIPQTICCLQIHGDMSYMLRWLTAVQEAEIDFVFLKKSSHMIWDLLCIETVLWDCTSSITCECLMQSKEKKKFRAQFFFQHFYCKVTTLPSSSCVISWGPKRKFEQSHTWHLLSVCSSLWREDCQESLSGWDLLPPLTDYTLVWSWCREDGLLSTHQTVKF